MKRIISAILSLLILGTCTCLATNTSTSSSETGTSVSAVSLDNIESILTSNSLDIKKINSDLDSAKETYRTLYDEVTDLNDVPLEYISSSELSSFLTEHSTLTKSCYKAECAYEVAQAEYNQEIQSVFLSAKQQFLSCILDSENLSLAKRKLTLEQTDLTNMATALSKGFASQSDYDTLSTQVSDLTTSVSNLTSQQQTDLLKLKSMLGMDASAQISLTAPSFSESDFKDIPSVDYSADKTLMLQNSALIKANQITYDSMNTKKYAASYEIAAQKIALEKSETSAADNFQAAYSSLVSKYQSLQASYTDLKNEENKLANETKEYNYKLSSSRAMSNMQLEYDTAQFTVQSNEYSLYSTYLSYQNMKLGY